MVAVVVEARLADRDHPRPRGQGLDLGEHLLGGKRGSHGGNGVVNTIERWWYTNNPPPTGGKPAAITTQKTVVDTTELGLLANVDETDILLVQPGISASIELDAAPGARYDATVRTIDVLPGQSARGGVSYRVRLVLAGGKYGDGRVAPNPRPGMSAVAHRQIEDGELLFNTAVEFSVVLVAPAGGEHRAIGKLLQKPGDDLSALGRIGKEIQAELQESLARLGFATRVIQQGRDVRQAQRDANARERPGLRHLS